MASSVVMFLEREIVLQSGHRSSHKIIRQSINMRIGVDVCCWSNNRGFGRFTRELLQTLISVDQKNEYIFFVDKDTAAMNEFPERVEVVVAQTSIAPTKAASASGRRSLRDVWALSRLVMKQDLDIFFFPAVYSYFPIYTKGKIIVTVHDIIAELYPELVFPEKKLNLFWKLKQYLANRQAHLILTVSEYSRQQIINYFKIPESCVRAITEAPGAIFTPLPHNKAMWQALNKYQLSSKQRFILHVGGISPHKNLATLVEVYGQLIKNPNYSDVKLVLVGDYKGDSFYTNYNALKQQIDKLGLGDMIIFTGFIQDQELAYLYNAALFLVFPSFQEGFGLPAVEAMACGIPVAASNKGSLPEIIGEGGCFFDPYNSAEMLDIIQNLICNDTLRGKMGQCGLLRSEQFSWDRAARQMLSIFNELHEA